MRTGLSVGVVALASLLLISGIVTTEGRLLALLLPLVAYLAMGVLFRSPPPQVNVIRRLEEETVHEAQEVEVAVDVENKGSAMEFLEFHDEVPAELEVVEGSNYVVAQLAPEEVRRFRYVLKPKVKGKFSIGPLQLRSRDLLGFFVYEVPAGESKTLLVSPRGEEIGRVEMRTYRTRPWLGQIPSRSPGPGSDFWTLRGYVSGDEMRRINWKASSRLDSLYTNEYEGEKSGDFIIILDAREEAAFGPIEENAVEMGVRATVSLATRLLENRNRVGLIVMRSVLDWVYPAFGRQQLLRILDALVTVRPGGEWTLGHLPWILTRFFPPRCQLIIISPVVDSRAFEAIAEMRVRGMDAVVISPSIVEIEAGLLERDERVEVATSILRLERQTHIAQLRRIAPVADWKPGEPLALALKEVELRRRGR